MCHFLGKSAFLDFGPCGLPGIAFIQKPLRSIIFVKDSVAQVDAVTSSISGLLLHIIIPKGPLFTPLF